MIQSWDRYKVNVWVATAVWHHHGHAAGGAAHTSLPQQGSEPEVGGRQSRKLEQVLSSPAPPLLHLISAGQPAVKTHIVPWPQKTHVSCLFALRPRCRARLSPARLCPVFQDLRDLWGELNFTGSVRVFTEFNLCVWPQHESQTS